MTAFMNKKILGLVLFITIAVIIISITAFQRYQREPITIYVGILVEEMNLEQLTQDSELIVIGEIVEAYPGRWNTNNGKLPWFISDLGDLTILSDFKFMIDQTLKGDSGLTTVDVRKFSGKVGKDEVIISAEETYEVGQKYLLFLIPDTGTTAEINPGHYLANGGTQGVIVIPETGIVQTVDGEWELEKLINYIRTKLQ